MATYFHGNPEIQNDGLQTLILMNPGYVGGYSSSDHHHHHQSTANNFVFLNSGNSLNLPHAPPPHSHHQQYVAGVTLPPPNSANASAAPSQQDPNNHPHEISATLHHQGFVPRVEYNLWNSFDSTTAARENRRAHSQQGLSLSLSSQQPHPAATAAYGSYRGGEREIAAQAPAVSAIPAAVSDGVRISGGSSSPASVISNGVSGLQQSVLLSSKYLKAAQLLLDEVVNVGNYGVKSESANKRADGESKLIGELVPGDGTGGGEVTGTKRGGGGRDELSTVERQEIQMKKAKLVGMLDEVEQRYRQYHHQMQIVISTFEQVVGIGSAKTYTALALQTISKQFRCLKDSISGQIRAANKCLGEDDPSGGRGGRSDSGSRLKFVDNQLRQQRALQQLGMIQPSAWRPQRGLPERSVSVLRAWLFEHFLHPYPKDSDKHMLAKQTGLTRSQVSNWFINARVRLWKPMVEEMYLEEVKEHEQSQSEEKTSKSDHHNNEDSVTTGQQDKSPITDSNQTNSFMSTQDNPNNNALPHPLISISTASTSPSVGCGGNGGSGYSQSCSGFAQQGSPKKPRSTESLFTPNTSSVCVPISMGMDIKPEESNLDLISSMKLGGGGDHRQSRDGYSLLSAPPSSYIGGFCSYPSIGEITRFNADQFSPRVMGNGVSLTLGLPHHNFHPNNMELGRRLDIGDGNEYGGTMNAAAAAAVVVTPSHSTNAYEDLSIQNRKRFAAQLLHDFVA